MGRWQRYGMFAAGLLSIWPAMGRETSAAAAPPAGARVCVINIASAERSCDGETPVKLQTMQPAGDSQSPPAIEALLSLTLAGYVGRGFRVVGCHDLPGGKDSVPICILARDGR